MLSMVESRFRDRVTEMVYAMRPSKATTGIQFKFRVGAVQAANAINGKV